MKRILTGVLLASAAIILAPFAAADGVKPTPGQYDSLLLGVDPASGAISGYFHQDRVGTGTEDNPQIICLFAFSGKVGEKKIVAWAPGDDEIVEGAVAIEGAISFKPIGVSLSFPKEPGGCLDASGPATRSIRF